MKYTLEKANNYILENKQKVNTKQRHKFHLMPEIGWMNDPNGFIFFEGYYHLFYQFYPYDAKWGAMHWGHAKTKDFVNYEHLPVALAPDLAHEDGCFSGGATVYQKELLLMYTSHYHQAYQLQEQSIAKSQDGIRFDKGLGKPIITIDDLPKNASKVDFRDPNPVLIDGKQFVLIGSSTLDNVGQILIYETKDFKTFTYLNAIKHPLFGEIAECPDLFELDGKHVLMFSSTNLKQENGRFKNINSSLYAVGEFNSATGEFLFLHVDELDAGHHYYAPQSTLNDKNERVSIAWMEMWGKDYYTALNDHKWAGALTFPRSLHIKEDRLIQSPFNLDKVTTKKTTKLSRNALVTSKFFHLYGTVDSLNNTSVFIGSDNNYIKLEITQNEIILDTSQTKLFALDKRNVTHNFKTVTFDLIMDNSSLELFIKDLDKTITTRVYFDEETLSIKTNNTHDTILLKELTF